jgi:type IV pilus assembly protein PilB
MVRLRSGRDAPKGGDPDRTSVAVQDGQKGQNGREPTDATRLSEESTSRVEPDATSSGGPRLGDLLVSQAVITSEELDAALLEQGLSGRRLGELLLESGLLTEQQLLAVLSEQLRLPVIDLRRTSPEPEAIAALPETLVRALPALPVRVRDEGLAVAMPGPPTPAQLEELRAAAGRPIAICLATASDIRVLIDRSYLAISGLDRLVEAFEGGEAARVGAAATPVLAGDNSAPIAQVLTRILTQAVRERASDIHIEPQDPDVRVRFRVDGALHDAITLPGAMAQALVSRIKILADMNIVERRRAQDGQLEVSVDGRGLDVRVATMATIWGEKVVMRILDKNRSLLELSRLGMTVDTRDDFTRLVRAPFGMVLCAGPTGSGKTTTLYAALNQISDTERNVTTIEDPVEYIFPSINQIQINEQADITFAGGLKAILRQDPDVILVGEIRDVETARIAVQSALTGHLVLSSLHATDATAALYRFLDMGIESFLVSSSVIGVVAQRLVRRTCAACREPYEPSAEELAFYEEWGGKPKDVFTHGVGCNFCSHTGFIDRIGVYELLRVTPEVKQLIIKNASHDELWELAVEQGMRTLRDEALRVIGEDVTTIGEVLRSVYIA